MKDAGEFAWLLEFGGAEGEANRAARATASAILATRMPGVLETVAAARSVLVHGTPDLDPELLRVFESAPLSSVEKEAEESPARTHEIQMTADGADADEIASRAGLSIEAFVTAFTGIEFTVGFLGFAPGFAYLYGLPAPFHLPRRGTPRVAVPAGSVALAGPYVGIYPAAMPGGWSLLGSTSRRLFAPAGDPPFLFAPGDRVRFTV